MGFGIPACLVLAGVFFATGVDGTDFAIPPEEIANFFTDSVALVVVTVERVFVASAR